MRRLGAAGAIAAAIGFGSLGCAAPAQQVPAAAPFSPEGTVASAPLAGPRSSLAAASESVSGSTAESASASTPATAPSSPPAVVRNALRVQPPQAQLIKHLRLANRNAEQAKSASFSVRGWTSTPDGLPITIEGTGVTTTAASVKSRAVMTVSAKGTSFVLETRLTPSAIYLKMPDEQARQGIGGKSWVMLSFASLSRDAGVDVQAMFAQADQGSATSTLKSLTAGSAIKDYGMETIDGRETSHYGTTVTRASLTKAVGADKTLQSRFASLMTELSGGPMETDVWIDRQGMPRRVRQLVTAGGHSKESITDFDDFGVKVDVAAPPAGDTVDAATLKR